MTICCFGIPQAGTPCIGWGISWSGMKVCHVASPVENGPHDVPVSHGYDADANALFFHTAKEGRKSECIEGNPHECLEGEVLVKAKAGDERECSRRSL